MKKYSKPAILVNDEYSEGVYAASGCYTVTASIRQDNQTGRTDYRIQVNGKHDSDHTRDAQTLTVPFKSSFHKICGITLFNCCSSFGSIISI